MSNCLQCGNEIPDDSRFCPFCGASISNANTVRDSVHDVSKESENKEIHNDQGTIIKERANDTRVRKGASAVYEKRDTIGKQQKHGKFIIPIVILSLIAVALAGLNIYQYKQKEEVLRQNEDVLRQADELHNTLAEKVKLISSLQTQINSQKNTINDLNNKNDNLALEKFKLWLSLLFYEENAAIVPNNGTYIYHVYGCDDLDLDSYNFNIYNTELAKAYGYKPCSKCVH